MMSVRLIELHRVLKPSGSMYLHCDPAASHYLKIVLDALFGAGRFQNEIIWQRTMAKSLQTQRLANNHDVLLYYCRGETRTWNRDAAIVPYDHDDLDQKTEENYSLLDEEGRRYQLTSLINPNRDRPNLTYEFLGVTRVWRWTRERMKTAYEAGEVVQTSPGIVPRFKRYLDEQKGKTLGDVWTDITPLNARAKERIGYPTQKPMELTDRIILMSSNPGDLVLDPFCGCGTTVESAERLGRRWVGIDIARKAVDIVEQRFKRTGLDPPATIWYPADPEGAEALAERDPHQFEQWALRRVGAKRHRKTDRGIDGEATFHSEGSKHWHVLVSVKGGKTLNPSMVRDLRGTLEREGASIGVLVTMHAPTEGMRREAALAQFLPNQDFQGPIPRIQILTVAEIFEGKRIRSPGSNVAPSNPITPSNQIALPIDIGIKAVKSADLPGTLPAVRKRA
jgi:site-specific DNA-methyltransferase (adenine-specific)